MIILTISNHSSGFFSGLSSVTPTTDTKAARKHVSSLLSSDMTDVPRLPSRDGSIAPGDSTLAS